MQWTTFLIEDRYHNVNIRLIHPTLPEDKTYIKPVSTSTAFKRSDPTTCHKPSPNRSNYWLITSLPGHYPINNLLALPVSSDAVNWLPWRVRSLGNLLSSSPNELRRSIVRLQSFSGVVYSSIVLRITSWLLPLFACRISLNYESKFSETSNGCMSKFGSRKLLNF